MDRATTRTLLALVMVLVCGCAAAPSAPEASPPAPIATTRPIATRPPAANRVSSGSSLGTMSPVARAQLEALLGVTPSNGDRVAILMAPRRGTVGEPVSIDFASLPSMVLETAHQEFTGPAGGDRVCLGHASPADIMIRPLEWVELANGNAADPETLRLRRYEGQINLQTDQRWMQRRGEVRARGIIPGVLYAFRRCVSGCDSPGESSRVDALELVGPSPRWIASSGIQEPMTPGQPFADVSTRVERGSSATLFLAATRGDIERFRRGPTAPHTEDQAERSKEIVTFTVDVVWEENDGPRATLFKGEFAGDTNGLFDTGGRGFPEWHCGG